VSGCDAAARSEQRAAFEGLLGSPAGGGGGGEEGIPGKEKAEGAGCVVEGGGVREGVVEAEAAGLDGNIGVEEFEAEAE